MSDSHSGTHRIAKVHLPTLTPSNHKLWAWDLSFVSFPDDCDAPEILKITAVLGPGD